jgi:hypothetical protein
MSFNEDDNIIVHNIEEKVTWKEAVISATPKPRPFMKKREIIFEVLTVSLYIMICRRLSIHLNVKILRQANIQKTINQRIYYAWFVFDFFHFHFEGRSYEDMIMSALY